MYRNAIKPIRVTPAFIISLLGKRNENDFNFLENSNPSDKPETGLDRVRKMYTLDEFDEVSVELNSVMQSTLVGSFFGACMGGFARSRKAYLYFIENNQATAFQTTMEAKQKLQNYVTVEFCKGVYSWGWRLGLFTGMFSIISTTIQVYRGDTSLVEYITAGALSGAFYKAHLGLAATMVGAGLGATLSLIAGMTILGILKITGISMDDIRKALYRIKQARDREFNRLKENYSSIKNDELTEHHDKLVIERGEANVNDMN